MSIKAFSSVLLYSTLFYSIRPSTVSQVQDYLSPFRLSLEKLQEISARLKRDLNRGLGRHAHHRAAVKMLPTFVRATPDGTGETTTVRVSHLFIYLFIYRIYRHKLPWLWNNQACSLFSNSRMINNMYYLGIESLQRAQLVVNLLSEFSYKPIMVL